MAVLNICSCEVIVGLRLFHSRSATSRSNFEDFLLHSSHDCFPSSSPSSSSVLAAYPRSIHSSLSSLGIASKADLICASKNGVFNTFVAVAKGFLTGLLERCRKMSGGASPKFFTRFSSPQLAFLRPDVFARVSLPLLFDKISSTLRGARTEISTISLLSMGCSSVVPGDTRTRRIL